MELDRARAADLKDELHRNCGPTVLVLPTAPVRAARPPQPASARAITAARPRCRPAARRR